MDITILDFQDRKSALNATVQSADAVLRLLESAPERAPFFCRLELVDYELTVGVGHGYGCVQHGPRGGKLPYMMAVAAEPAIAAKYGRFLSGSQNSEVPNRYCISWRELREVVSFFVNNAGERTPSLRWEELGSW